MSFLFSNLFFRMNFCVFFNFIFDLPHVITKLNNSSIVNDYTTSDKTKKKQPYLESLQKIMFFMTNQFAIVCNWLSHATLKGYVQLHLKSRWILVTFIIMVRLILISSLKMNDFYIWLCTNMLSYIWVVT